LKGQRILIFGAGAIGLWLAGRLRRTGYAVTAITRLDHYEAIKTKGLIISENGATEVISDLSIYPHLYALPKAELNEVTWFFLTVKAYDVGNALEELSKLLKPDDALVSFQNGVGTEDLFIQKISKDKLFFASLTKSVAILKPGHLISSPQGGVGIASYLKNNPGLKDLSKILKASSILVKSYHNFREMRWSKLLLNILGNATSAIMDYSTEEIFKRKALFAFELESLREAVKVISKLKLSWQALPGFSLPPFKEILIFLPAGFLYPFWSKKMIQGRGEKSPSLRLEMKRGKGKSEIEYLNGAVVKWGKKVKIKTPANEFLCQILAKIMSNKISQDIYWHNPEKFLQDYQEFKTKCRELGEERR
jgi:2-dehydropantoate 2-reductase